MLVGMLVKTSAVAETPFKLPSEDRVLPSSLDLERKVEPWCPGDCAVIVPFVASYRKGKERLVFVGVRHAFSPNDPTMRAVAAGFAMIHPNVVIVEGFPTVMGENPPPLVAEAQRYGAHDANEHDRGEEMYAASIALVRGIPFVGGEPTREEENQALKAKGFTDADVAFTYLLGRFSGALRSGDIPGTSRESLAKARIRRQADILRERDVIDGAVVHDGAKLKDIGRRPCAPRARICELSPRASRHAPYCLPEPTDQERAQPRAYFSGRGVQKFHAMAKSSP